MGFKTDAFMSAQFEARLAEVDCADIADWFDGEPKWTVRGLTANEIWKCKNAGARRDNAKAFVEALSKGSKADKAEEFAKAFGVSDDVEAEVVIRQEMLAIASVDPEIDITVAVKLANVHGIVFQKLTDKILELSGQGQIEQGKPKASTAKQKSKAPSS